MTKYVIPLDPIPNQVFNIELNGQQCTFEFITRGVFMYMNLTVDNENIVNGQICLNKVNLNQYNKNKFKGNIYFEDTSGDLDPLYYGLNNRWMLFYEG